MHPREMASKLNEVPDADKGRPIHIKEKKHRMQSFKFDSVEAAVIALANAHNPAAAAPPALPPAAAVPEVPEEAPPDFHKQLKWRYQDLPPVQEGNPFQWSSYEGPDEVLADMDKLSEDNQLRPILVRAEDEEKTYSNAEELRKALTPEFHWMFGDMHDVEVARHNPFRWSPNEGLEAVIADLQRLSDAEKQRKVIVKVRREEYEYSSVNEVLRVLSPSVNWMFADLSGGEYHNPFRWSGNESLEDAYEDMQLLNEEDLARPVIVREGGHERTYTSVAECLAQLAPLVGKAGGAGDWCLENTWQIAQKGEEHIFEGKAAVLHTGGSGSVSKAVADLNLGTLKCPAGISVMWSDSHDAYFLLYRSDMQAEASSKFDMVGSS